jgi:hypothetical protein
VTTAEESWEPTRFVLRDDCLGERSLNVSALRMLQSGKEWNGVQVKADRRHFDGDHRGCIAVYCDVARGAVQVGADAAKTDGERHGSAVGSGREDSPPPYSAQRERAVTMVEGLRFSERGFAEVVTEWKVLGVMVFRREETTKQLRRGKYE